MGEQQQERQQPGTGKWQLCLCRLTFLPCLALLVTLPIARCVACVACVALPHVAVIFHSSFRPVFPAYPFVPDLILSSPPPSHLAPPCSPVAFYCQSLL